LLTGGTGRDTFDFNRVSEIGSAAGSRDIIQDFVEGFDRIDLRTIDASTASGNQNFHFVTAEGGSFSGAKAS
jgi:Ca2+-binding RTX toxin-like protein